MINIPGFGNCGMIGVKFLDDDCEVLCRNGLTDKVVSFITTKELGEKLEQWRQNPARSPINVAFPELSADEREMCLSGMSPTEWDDAFEEE